MKKELKVTNNLGLHARVAAKIAETVRTFQCEVVLKKDGVEADGASVLSILALDAPRGSLLEAEVSGQRALECFEALEGLFTNGFGEA
ncbi:MAG: HPr family phosphocarrier protein [Deltaproteobacteria bacterium]|nr:HPr family phosphocarrier protein [Deltaproteobacteria bacterium]